MKEVEKTGTDQRKDGTAPEAKMFLLGGRCTVYTLRVPIDRSGHPRWTHDNRHLIEKRGRAPGVHEAPGCGRKE